MKKLLLVIVVILVVVGGGAYLWYSMIGKSPEEARQGSEQALGALFDKAREGIVSLGKLAEGQAGKDAQAQAAKTISDLLDQAAKAAPEQMKALREQLRGLASPDMLKNLPPDIAERLRKFLEGK